MSSSQELLAEAVSARESSETAAPQRPEPFFELSHGDGYRLASVDVLDLDPPTYFPPSPEN